jgi:hypothetical protein
VLNFNLVSETQPKINIQTYLFVLKSSFEHISRKKNGSSENRFETISHSHLISKFNFGKHPYQNLGRPKNTHERLGTLFQSVASKTVKTFSTRFNISFEAHEDVKDAKQQETCRFSPLINFELKTRSFLLYLKIFCFRTKPLKVPAFTLAHKDFSGAHNSRAFFHKTMRTHSCSKSDQGSF